MRYNINLKSASFESSGAHALIAGLRSRFAEKFAEAETSREYWELSDWFPVGSLTNGAFGNLVQGFTDTVLTVNSGLLTQRPTRVDAAGHVHYTRMCDAQNEACGHIESKGSRPYADGTFAFRNLILANSDTFSLLGVENTRAQMWVGPTEHLRKQYDSHRKVSGSVPGMYGDKGVVTLKFDVDAAPKWLSQYAIPATDVTRLWRTVASAY